MRRDEIGDYVSRCASLAALMEVSAYPKPGNIHRTRDLPDTRFEHFLSGAVAIGPDMRELATRGIDAVSSELGWDQLSVGRSVLNAVVDSMDWQKGGNVNLGNRPSLCSDSGCSWSNSPRIRRHRHPEST